MVSIQSFKEVANATPRQLLFTYARTRRTAQQCPFGYFRAQLGELLRILEELHELHHLHLRLIEPRNISKRHFGRSALTRTNDSGGGLPNLKDSTGTANTPSFASTSHHTVEG